MFFLENVLSYCKRYHLSEAAFEKAAGLSKGQINKWKKGFTPRISSMQKCASFLEIDIFDLMNKRLFQRDDVSEVRETNASIDQSTLSIPIINKKEKTNDESLTDQSSDMISIVLDSAIGSSDYFAMFMKDSSMEPDISTGDLIIADKNADRQTGDIVVVSTPGLPVMCRKLVRAGAGIILQPSNMEFDSIYYSDSEIKDLPVAITGKVVKLVRNYE